MRRGEIIFSMHFETSVEPVQLLVGFWIKPFTVSEILYCIWQFGCKQAGIFEWKKQCPFPFKTSYLHTSQTRRKDLHEHGLSNRRREKERDEEERETSILLSVCFCNDFVSTKGTNIHLAFDITQTYSNFIQKCIQLKFVMICY